MPQQEIECKPTTESPTVFAFKPFGIKLSRVRVTNDEIYSSTYSLETPLINLNLIFKLDI
jgi:hypothetical protein